MKRPFRKGDKITFVTEVIRDQRMTAHGPVPYIDVQCDGVSGIITDKMLRSGVLTPVPEPPYVPKVGEEFYGNDGHIQSPYTLIFRDERTWLVSQGGDRFILRIEYRRHPRPA